MARKAGSRKAIFMRHRKRTHSLDRCDLPGVNRLVTAEDLKQMFFEEKNFTDQEEYCRAYKLLFTGTAFVQAESDALGGIGCAQYDL